MSSDAIVIRKPLHAIGQSSYDLAMSSSAPIGVFDSGLGGLTVFRALRQALPHESLLYVGDTARLPYGNKSAETIVRYAREVADFLTEHHVKALVVACNTASALAVPTLAQQWAFPVIGMIAPGVSRALSVSERQRIGVIGTAATIVSGAYERELRARAPRAFVVSQACPLFVPLVEEGWIDTPVTTEIATHYLSDLCAHEVDTVILGCTHYPILRDTIQRVMGSTVTLVDSGAAAAASLQEVLTERYLMAPASARPAHRVFVTDTTTQFSQLAHLVADEHLPPVVTIQL